MKLKFSAQCPCNCNSNKLYADCCKPFHEGAALAPTPEALMRSRYSAYVLQRADYLLATWHPSTSPGDLDIGPFMKWLSLEVLHAESSNDAGVVEFVARYKDNGRAGTLHEISRFVKIKERWFYIDGQQVNADEEA